MNAKAPFVEIECSQLIKYGQSACGDDFQWARLENEDRNIAVLSDGLGSGIKANLLANMTTTMALRFMKSNMAILQSAETIMDSLPVCEIRKISYA
ncbi:MAG: serine/threonine protein phosphatase, partial [Planctomycetia bacterium]|nr:serine/threonine protein phosphatase [Planctomycetia bacterium]